MSKIGLLPCANKFGRNLIAGDRRLKRESAIDCSLHRLSFATDDQSVTSSRKAGEGERDGMREVRVVFEREAQVREAVVVRDRLLRGEGIAIQQQIRPIPR